MANKWYPTQDQLKDPQATQHAMKQVLDQLYTLQDAHAKLSADHAALKARVPDASKNPFPPGSGPADTVLLGLPVAPVDTNSLANGAALKYNKASGNFQFS
jgi:hypothetical protein